MKRTKISFIPGVALMLACVMASGTQTCSAQIKQKAGPVASNSEPPQTAHSDLVKSAKTRSGSVSYIEISPEKFDVNFFSKTAGETTDFAGAVHQLAAAKKDVVFAMNGGKCDKSLTALGLVIKGDTKHKDFVASAAFGGPDECGVFAVDRDNHIHIIPGKNFKPESDLATYKLAIESGPMLMTRGFLNSKITHVANKQIANAVGIKANGNIVMAITDQEISLHDFAVFFQMQDCKEVLLLDEGTNCQWWVPGEQKKTGKMGEIVVVTRK